MKKISILFAALAAFSFFSCSKTEVCEAPDGAKGFAISTLITRTVNDGASTEWNAGDAINVFHASAGTTTYGTNDKFTIAEEDLGTGTFRGTLTEAQYDSNDWYAFYPYNSDLTTPANTDACYFIGCNNSHNSAQVQNGNNSTTHLCGEHFPMWAQAKAVAKGSGISLTFNNAVSIVKFHVTNKTSEPVTVTSLSMTAEEDIIGSYYIDFSGDAPVFTASDASYVAKEAKLSVSNGIALDVNASADFYLAIKPFNNEAGKEITFNVNGCEKTITTAESFLPGNIKTVNFSYVKDPIVLDLTTKAAKCNAYNKTTEYGDWKIVNGANNNGGWAYFKMGGKSSTIATYNPCYIYYTQEVSDKIDEITVSLPTGSLSKSGMSVKSWGVYIYSDKAMETQVDYVAGGTITRNSGSFSFKPTEGKTWQNCYVKVSWDLANTTSTVGIVCVSNVTINF